MALKWIIFYRNLLSLITKLIYSPNDVIAGNNLGKDIETKGYKLYKTTFERGQILKTVNFP